MVSRVIQIGEPLRINAKDLVTTNQSPRCQQQGDAENRRDHLVGTTSPHIQPRQHYQSEAGSRYAAGGQSSHDSPVNRSVEAMHKTSNRLGSCCEKQVCPNSRCWGNTKQHDENRRHQRSAAYASHAYKRANEESGDRVMRIDRTRGHSASFARCRIIGLSNLVMQARRKSLFQ